MLTVTAAPGADLDLAAAPEFGRVVAAACWHAEADPALILRLDLSGAKYIDSSGLAVLVDARKRIGGRRVILRALANSQVAAVLRLSHICSLFECEEV